MKRKWIFTAATACVLPFFFGSCENGETSARKSKTKNAETTQSVSAKTDCSAVHWTHEQGPKGPDNWKHLCKDFATCGGKRQSPIDIVTAKVQHDENLQPPQWNYGTTTVDIVNNGHTVQFNVHGDHNVELNGKTYKLLQFHYHAPSEHTVDGKHYPLEVHFVHKHSDDDYAVLGIFFIQGAEDQLFARYLDSIPEQVGSYTSSQTIDLKELFPSDRSYYHYEGSLTTPPCSEVVRWYVLKTPVEASAEQLKRFADILNNNYRPVQPLNDRVVRLYRD